MFSGQTRPGWNPGIVLWAEALSCQMEYKFLAHLTGRTQYYQKVEHIMEIMYNTTTANDLFPTQWDIESGTPQNSQCISY
jgi:mannosyl-oligosaccharide alpha-1,2-mannosidase